MTLAARVLTLTYLLNRKIKEYYKHDNVYYNVSVHVHNVINNYNIKSSYFKTIIIN